jgi:hypothetical protein
VSALSGAERLMLAGEFGAAADILEDLLELRPTVEVHYLLATSQLQLGRYDSALRHATAALDSDPSLAPARDLLARVKLALGQYDSALSEYLALAALCREQQPAPPEQFSIPAHFALHNIEQLEHILAAAPRERAAVMTADLEAFRRGLAEVIDKAQGEAPQISVPANGRRLLADPPYVRVDEERLPRYLNEAVDYPAIQRGIATGRQIQVIDDFLTPDALEQVRTFCLESTVWRRPYKFGYVGAFPQDGFASVSLFAIAEELLAALGEAVKDCYFAQWWGFVYNSDLPGTDIHGDDADFSLNLWITPDSANLDPDSGGLVMWDKTAPSDWSFDEYNSGGERVRQYLEAHNAESQVIAHRANRAVLFDGRLFHRTDRFDFAPGFANRRRSVTFLFRRRRR